MTRVGIRANRTGRARRFGPVLALAAVLGLGGPAVARADSWLVPAQQPTIGAAIAAAAVGDTIVVACGTYSEHGLVVGKALTISGETGDPACVVVDGLGLGRVFDVDGTQGQVTFSGLTITGGAVSGGFLTALGAGIRCQGGAVRVADCRFTGNAAVIGAGFGAEQAVIELVDCAFDANTAVDPVWAAGGGAWCRDSSGTIDRCTFSGNSAFSDNPDDPGDGGGLFINGSQLAIRDCLFTANDTGGGAGGFYAVDLDDSVLERCEMRGNSARWGGGIYLENTRTRLDDCLIEDNTATSGGGALIGRSTSSLLTGCRFLANTATAGTGGGIDSWQSWPDLTACVFVGNSASGSGGGMNCGGTRPDLVDCVFLDNVAGVRGGALYGTYADIKLTGCTLAGNRAASGGGVSSGTSSFATLERTIIAFSGSGGALHQTGIFAYTIGNSDLFGNAGGDWTGAVAPLLGQDGNFSADPLFCALGDGDLRLDAASPCAPGEVTPGPVGAFGVGCGLSAAPPAPPTDFGIEPNYPNPFNPSTTLRFRLPAAAPTRVTVHDAAGRLVRVLVDEPLPAGTHAVVWDGRGREGRPVAAGVYLYVVGSGPHLGSGRMVILK